MKRQTIVSPGSISPRCDGARRLAASVVAHTALTLDDRRQMFALLRTHFTGTDRARFDADLREKETVILLRDQATGLVQGFSTLMRMTARLEKREIVSFFSGDTIIDRQYWGESTLSRTWGQVVFAEADRVAFERPGTAVYWFLICSGYKTWRFLPVFFRHFYPNPDQPTPPDVRRLLDTLARRKFGDEYLPAEGIVRFRSATPLRPGIAEVTGERLRDPNVAFFARLNPGHSAGDELACLAEISRSNLTRAGLRMVAAP
jgi:hypothetical protein